MSGFTGIVASAPALINAASGVGSALGLGSLSTALFGGSSNGVTLGSVVFGQMEVPHQISVGREMTLAVHHLIGGRRIVNPMGNIDEDLEWEGIFRGPTAVARFQQLFAYEAAGAPINLSFGSFAYQVYVRRVYVDYQRTNWVPYRIVCQVLRNLSSSATTASPGLLQRIASSVTSALGITPTNLTQITSTISAVQQATGVLSAVFPRTQAFQNITGLLAASNTTVTGLSAAAIGQVGALSTIAAGATGLVGGVTGATAGFNVVNLTVYAQQQATLPVAAAHLRQAQIAAALAAAPGAANVNPLPQGVVTTLSGGTTTTSLTSTLTTAGVSKGVTATLETDGVAIGVSRP